jgi:hypothetical protein
MKEFVFLIKIIFSTGASGNVEDYVKLEKFKSYSNCEILKKELEQLDNKKKYLCVEGIIE